ncbi:hypothetical protein J2T17_007015 [Paenibacillus mucilaginosus]|uniref:hypothetical protein n=1 Tax=Paenibacillus mucilaginosus TaxID=61624 RepID=UPI003D1C3BFD
MKTFILGLTCGLALSAAAAAAAAETLQVYGFPAAFEINGQMKEPGSEYTVLNYNGHAYVPIRFIGESLGLGVRYIDRDRVISLQNEPGEADAASKALWRVQYRLNIGQDAAAVKKLLGSPAAERTAGDRQKAVWRYDFAAAAGYGYDAFAIDRSGLEEGSLQGQLLVTWSEAGSVERIEMWYPKVQGSERRLYTHYLYPDGSSGGALIE